MKVLLLSDVDNLGTEGDLVEVKDGYGYNYLIPQGLATIATKANMNQVIAQQRAAQHRAQKRLELAQEQGKSLQGKIISLAAKCGEGGRLYGTITKQDIADKLAEMGYELDRRHIQIDEDIKAVGEYEAEVRLHAEVTVPFTVEIKALEE